MLSLSAQTSIQGAVKEAGSGEPVIGANVALYRNGVLLTGTQTDFDGNFYISDIQPGTYDVEASAVGFSANRTTGVIAKGGQTTRVNFELSAGVLTDEIVITEYKTKLIDFDNTSTGTTITSEKINSLPVKGINSIVATSAGVSSTDGGDVSIRGSRSNETAYFIDGIRVSGGLIPQSEIEQMQIITGGIEARYGDVTSGIISITSKGPSSKFSGGIEYETSEGLDGFGYNLLSGNFAGPILNNKKGETVLGYRFSGQYIGLRDDSPAANGVFRFPESVIQELEREPVFFVGESGFPTAQRLGNAAIGGVRTTRPNENNRDLNITGRIDARLSDAIDLSLSGNIVNNSNRFAPSTGWAFLNWTNNPYDRVNRKRVNFNFRHKLGKQGAEGEASNATLRNLSYNIQLGFERRNGNSEDLRHEDRLFNYGYFGVTPTVWEPTFQVFQNEETGGVEFGHLGYGQVTEGFIPNQTINPVLAANNTQNGIIVNSQFNNVWNNLFQNVGQVFNRFSRSESDIYTFNLNTNFDIVPKGSGGRHNIQFGVMYEQRIQRAYNLAPFGLHRLGDILVNNHILGINRQDTVGFRDVFNPLTGAVESTPFFNTLVDLNPESKFLYEVRSRIGNVSVNDYVNLSAIDPSQLSLDMFSAQELTDQGLLAYYGYDYLGNKVPSSTTFEDFFTGRGADGRRSFNVAPFSPIYGAAYIQDKFTYKDIIFRVGLRMDYYDANTKVLKDPYSLYEIETANDFFARTGQERPASIGNDYKVYVADETSNTVVAYREGDQWFLPNGTAVSGGNVIFGQGIVYPSYKGRTEGRVLNIQDPNFDINTSFDDYTPQVNFMPRLAFSFPISEDAGFFAHYDVLYQRPTSNTQMSALDYFYFEGVGSNVFNYGGQGSYANGMRGGGPANNPDLRPVRTVDYEVGFQQKISQTSALKISAYYKEVKDLIQRRVFLNVPAPIGRYEAFGNLDFSTVKGFSFQYDRRRTSNLELSATYTLQFADGSGSDANSSAGINNRGPIRNLIPLSFDERHRITAVVDYRYASGKNYNGPRINGVDILANAGINFTAIAVSGQPFTRRAIVEQLGGSGYVGSINGARLPWNFSIDLRADKRFKITTNKETGKALNANVYLRVQNLLDTRNVANVFPFTGDPNDDGYLTSNFGVDRLNDIRRSGLDEQLFLEAYSWRLNVPGNFFLPRRIYLGMILDF